MAIKSVTFKLDVDVYEALKGYAGDGDLSDTANAVIRVALGRIAAVQKYAKSKAAKAKKAKKAEKAAK